MFNSCKSIAGDRRSQSESCEESRFGCCLILTNAKRSMMPLIGNPNHRQHGRAASYFGPRRENWLTQPNGWRMIWTIKGTGQRPDSRCLPKELGVTNPCRHAAFGRLPVRGTFLQRTYSISLTCTVSASAFETSAVTGMLREHAAGLRARRFFIPSSRSTAHLDRQRIRSEISAGRRRCPRGFQTYP